MNTSKQMISDALAFAFLHPLFGVWLALGLIVVAGPAEHFVSATSD
jgi:hypothetical protein